MALPPPSPACCAATSISWWSASNAALPFVDAKTVKPLAVTSAKRSPQFPDVPTMEEQGFKNFQMYGWAMLFAPSGTPQPIVAKLHGEIAKAAH